MPYSQGTSRRKQGLDQGEGHAGERSRQGAVPLGTAFGQVNSSNAAVRQGFARGLEPDYASGRFQPETIMVLVAGQPQ
jgi:hypothetical protein